MDLLNIYLLVQEFYAIEAISAMLSVNQGSNFEPMRHSHSRWYGDFHDFRAEYIIKFASAIYDYTVSVVAAELRHCRERASQYMTEYYTTSQSRDAVYAECSVYNAHDVLSAGIRMFDTNHVTWNSGYGGDKWKQIAKAGLMKGKVSDCVFIDHCVDLSHNNSIYFDKSARIFLLQDRVKYQNFLDLKRNCEPQSLITTKQGFNFNRLFFRANNLNIIETQTMDNTDLSDRNKAESLLFSYRPIVWGAKRLVCSESNIVTNDYFRGGRDRDERDNERDDYREDDHDCDRQDDPQEGHKANIKYARCA